MVVQQPSIAATALCRGLWLCRKPPLRGDWRSAAVRGYLMVTAVPFVHGRAPRPQPQAACAQHCISRLYSPSFLGERGRGQSRTTPQTITFIHLDLPDALLGARGCLPRWARIFGNRTKSVCTIIGRRASRRTRTINARRRSLGAPRGTGGPPQRGTGTNLRYHTRANRRS